MNATTPDGESVKARLAVQDWLAIAGIVLAQAVAILGWGVALDRRVTKVEAVTESYQKPMESAAANNGVLQRIDQSLVDINRRLERLEDGKMAITHP